MTCSCIGAVGLQGVAKGFKVLLGECGHGKTVKREGAGNAGKEGVCNLVLRRRELVKIDS